MHYIACGAARAIAAIVNPTPEQLERHDRWVMDHPLLMALALIAIIALAGNLEAM